MESGWAGLEASGRRNGIPRCQLLGTARFLEQEIIPAATCFGENWQATSYKPHVPIKQVSTTTCSIIALPNPS